MDEQQRQNWVAEMGLENLTQDQINQLTLKIVEWVEAAGGSVGGGFIPDTEVDNGQEDASAM